MKTMIVYCIPLLLAGQASAPNTSTQTPDVGTNVKQPVVDFYDSLADYFHISSRAVEAIAQKGIPDQEIAAVLLIARGSAASPNQVIAARKAGRSFSDIAAAENVKLPGADFATEANVTFLSEYHGRSSQEIRELNRKGASFIDINEQYRRVGMKPKTEVPAGKR